MHPPLALDIGGANIKASDGADRSVSRPFPMWRQPEQLSEALRGIITEFERTDRLAVTMTGELADCFTTKAQGVCHIIDAVESAAGNVPVAIWTTGGEFVSPDDARQLAPLVAAANWHALATWAARSTPGGTALLIDLGSTTADIIPLQDGIPVPHGRTDLERLQSGELVYTGVRRTPVCAVASRVPLRGGFCPLASELFATMHDVYLICGNVRDDPADTDTANGRPATRANAHDRLARMVCADVTELARDELERIAVALAAAQRQRLSAAIEAALTRLRQPCDLVIVSGEGAFAIVQVLAEMDGLGAVPRLMLAETLGPRHSDAACAYALARLSGERISCDR